MGLTPRSLACERAVEQPAPGVEESWLRRTLLTIGGFYSRESRLIRGAKVLYNDIVEQATNKDFYKGEALSHIILCRAIISAHDIVTTCFLFS